MLIVNNGGLNMKLYIVKQIKGARIIGKAIVMAESAGEAIRKYSEKVKIEDGYTIRAHETETDVWTY